MLVVIEGADFAGKSTVAELIRRRLTAAGVPTIGSQACVSRGMMHRLVLAVQARPHLPSVVKSAIFHAGYAVDAFCEVPTGTVIVQESYVLRVKAYDEVFNRRLGRVVLSALKSRLLQPALAYLLKCPFVERRARWLRSSTSDPRDTARFGPQAEVTRRLECTLRRLAESAGYRIVDTAAVSPDRIAGAIVEDILSFRSDT